MHLICVSGDLQGHCPPVRPLEDMHTDCNSTPWSRFSTDPDTCVGSTQTLWHTAQVQESMPKHGCRAEAPTSAAGRAAGRMAAFTTPTRQSLKPAATCGGPGVAVRGVLSALFSSSTAGCPASAELQCPPFLGVALFMMWLFS